MVEIWSLPIFENGSYNRCTMNGWVRIHGPDHKLQLTLNLACNLSSLQNLCKSIICNGQWGESSRYMPAVGQNRNTCILDIHFIFCNHLLTLIAYGAILFYFWEENHNVVTWHKLQGEVNEQVLQCLGHQHVPHRDPCFLHNFELTAIPHHQQQTYEQIVHLRPNSH
jgi:hypothetical protein